MQYEPDTHKTGRIDSDKPATIHIEVPHDDAWTIDATHHITNDDTGVVSIYRDARSDGIDIQTHVSRCVIDRRPSDSGPDPCTGASETVNDDSDELKVMTDGGRDVLARDLPPCTECGADLVKTAEMGMAPLYPQEINPRQSFDMPTATCGECGQSVGAKLGFWAVLALVDALGDPRDTDDSRLVTDGGRDVPDVPIVEGDPGDGAVGVGLMHDGDEWCVVFDEHLPEWSQSDLEPWLPDRLDAPNTVAEARDDDRVFVSGRYGEPGMSDVSFDDLVVARAAVNDAGTWVVDIVIDDPDEPVNDDENPRVMTDGGRDVVEADLVEDRVSRGDTVNLDEYLSQKYWVVSVRGDRVVVEHVETGEREELFDPEIHLVDTPFRTALEGRCERCSDTVRSRSRMDMCGPCYHLPCPGCDTGHEGGYVGNPRCTEGCGWFDDDSTPEIVTDGGEPQSIAVVDARTPREYRVDCPLTFTVEIGDRVGEVTEIDVRTSDTPHITVESGDFAATVKAGYWQCDECERLALADACGQFRVCQFCRGARRQETSKKPETSDDATAEDVEEVLR